MSRLQFAVVAVCSALATAVVLSTGVGATGPSERLAAALREARTTVVPLAATPAPAAAVVEPVADDTTAPAVTGVSAGPVATAEEVPVETPVETVPQAPVTTTPTAPVQPDRTNINHVFVINLAGRGFDAAFGPQSPATYLNTQLRPLGTLLTGHETLGTAVLADRLALISGQPPNAETARDCPVYKEIPQATQPSKSGEITIDGCVYPSSVITVGDQLTAGGRTWRAYVEDLDQGPDARKSCRRPASNADDPTPAGRPGDGYATRNNPFVFFHSLLDLGDCDALDGPLERLTNDLAKVDSTPAYSYIAPNLCNDGTDTPCADGGPGGLAAADAFLSTWAPKILASPAYQQAGLLLVTFAGDVTPGAAAGQARTGTLLVSRFATAGAAVDAKTDPYTLLRTIQDALGLRPLARAATATSLLDTVLAAAKIAKPGDD